MAIQYRKLSELYESTAREIMSSPQKWKSYLRCACNNFRLPFHEQILVYAQRPDATALLEMERWNQQFGRWVRRGSAGVAVFDADYDGLRMKYYFDVSDTVPTRDARPVPIWKITPDEAPDVIAALKERYSLDARLSELPETLTNAARSAIGEIFETALKELKTTLPGSSLADREESFAVEKFGLTLEKSVTYMLLSRCDQSPDRYLTDEDFRDIDLFDTPPLVNLLGVSVGDAAKSCLNEIGKIALNLQRAKELERRLNHGKQGRNHLQIGGRLPSAQSTAQSAPEGDAGELRQREAEISVGESQGDLHDPALDGSVDRSSGTDRTQSPRIGEETDEANGRDGGADRTSEGERPDGMGAPDEQHPEPGEGDREGTGDQRLGWFDWEQEDKRLPFFGRTREKQSFLSNAPSDPVQGEDSEPQFQYKYEIGDSVYIGDQEFEILSFNENVVLLVDPQFPLFRQEMPRDEFDRKVRENPQNDHLKVQEEVNLNPKVRFDSMEFEKLIPHEMRYKLFDLVNGNEMFWVTQAPFTVEQLGEFQQAIRVYDSDVKKFYVTYRNLSGYNFEGDLERNVLAVVTPDTVLKDGYVRAMDDYVRAMQEKGLYPTRETSVEPPTYDIDMGYLGNGLTVWNKAVEVNGDYQTIAHISPEGEISYRVSGRPAEVVERSEQAAESERKNARFTASYREYAEIKHDNPEGIVLFPVGDFYEMYGSDAELAADVLELRLTSRAVNANERVPMCGIPAHRLQGYVDALLEHGHNVAIVSLENGKRTVRTLDADRKEEPDPDQAQTEQDAPAPQLTELQKKAAEISKKYMNLSMQEKIGVIAQVFGAKSGKVVTSPCKGRWRGTSDISIRFDNNISLFRK